MTAPADPTRPSLKIPRERLDELSKFFGDSYKAVAEIDTESEYSGRSARLHRYSPAVVSIPTTPDGVTSLVW